MYKNIKQLMLLQQINLLQLITKMNVMCHLLQIVCSVIYAFYEFISASWSPLLCTYLKGSSGLQFFLLQILQITVFFFLQASA